MKNKLLALNFFYIENDNHLPRINMSGEFLFDTGFIPHRMLVAEIYEGKIIIKEAPNFTKTVD